MQERPEHDQRPTKRRKVSPLPGLLHKLIAQIDNSQPLDFIQDLLLFAHLIPCCQNYEAAPTYSKAAFERVMDTQIIRDSRWYELVAYLINHPLNRGFSFYLRETQQLPHLRWEQLLCLMRNIFSHEYSFTWTILREMAQHVIQAFGSREMVEKLLLTHHHIVLDGQRASK